MKPATERDRQHVKAGGGRGVGGLISFRADDTTRSGQENNAICLACHEKGDRTYWTGTPTNTQRGLHELPHDHEEVSQKSSSRR